MGRMDADWPGQVLQGGGFARECTALERYRQGSGVVSADLHLVLQNAAATPILAAASWHAGHTGAASTAHTSSTSIAGHFTSHFSDTAAAHRP